MKAEIEEGITERLPKAPVGTVRPSVASRSRLVLPALLTGLLLWTCHFPVACGWLGWVALVPLLCLVRAEARPWRWLLASWLAGLAFYVPALQWLRVADDRMYFTWIWLAFYCSAYFPVAIGLVRAIDRRGRLPLVWTFPAVWTALEYVRAHLITGFPWYFLGHTQHDFLPAIQIADLAGAYGVTFLVAAVNAVLFEFLVTRPWFRALFRLPESSALLWSLRIHAGIVGLLLLGTLGYGFWRLSQHEFTPGPRIALVQSNLDQRIRNTQTSEAAQLMVDHNRRLTNLALNNQPGTDLIVWPETSYPQDWSTISADVPADKISADWKERAADSIELGRRVGRHWPTNVLLGINVWSLEGDQKERRYNSALLIRADGNLDGRYDKIHRVPFGEYVPLRDVLPFMNWFAPYDYDFSISAGQKQSRFVLGPYQFGVLICYEDSDADLARPYVRNSSAGRPVDFLVNISNDGWFDGTSEHEEHLAVCRFRAVECRRTVARSVNMGISAVIDSSGRVLQPEETSPSTIVHFWDLKPDAAALPVSRWHESKKVAGVLNAVIPIDHRVSLYAEWGDWLPQGCLLVAAVGLIWRRRSSSPLVV